MIVTRAEKTRMWEKAECWILAKSSDTYVANKGSSDEVSDGNEDSIRPWITATFLTLWQIICLFDRGLHLKMMY